MILSAHPFFISSCGSQVFMQKFTASLSFSTVTEHQKMINTLSQQSVFNRIMCMDIHATMVPILVNIPNKYIYIYMYTQHVLNYICEQLKFQVGI